MASGSGSGAASAAAAPAPVFVLDALKHTDPLPGPVWRDRLFCSFVADAYMESTELAGLDQKRGGAMGPLLQVLAFLAEQTKNERQAELAAVGVDAQGMRALDKVIMIFKTSVALAKGLAAVNTPDQFAQFLFQFKSTVRQMAPTEKLLIPGGWRTMDGGHSVMHVVERTERDFCFTVHNTGKGTEYHPSTVTSHPKTKHQTSLKFTNLSLDKMTDDAFWYMLFKMQVSQSDDHRCEILYDVLLPHLLEACIGVAIARQAERDPAAAALCEFRTAQRAEINYLKSSKEALRYLLREEGWTREQCKHFSFLMRRQLLDMAAQDLNQLESISESEAKLLRVATQNLARAATKESQSMNPKRLEADGLEEVWAQLQWAESQINAKLVPAEVMPKLDMELKAEFQPFPNFALFRREQPVEQFAGFKKPKAENSLIDFLSLPAKSSDIHHFGDVLNALVRCHSLCERLSTQSSSASYFHRLALIQDFFCHLLPRPLPPYRPRKPTLDSQGREVPAAECLYATAVIDRATQMQVLNVLLELSKHYMACARSVKTNRAMEGSHAIVMATIVAVTDAVLRIPACDETSIITLVLNGTESRAKSKSKSFASPYNSMAMGRRQMQSAIAGFQTQLGGFGFGGGSVASSAPKPSRAPMVEVIVTSTSSAASSSSASSSTTSVASATASAAATESSSASAAASSAAGSSAASSASSTAAAASSSSAASAAAVPMDEETKKKVAEAQKLLTDALAAFAKQQTAQSAAMEAASMKEVTPLFYTSLQNGRGQELIEMSEKLLLTQPALAVARGEVLEYFCSQAEVATKQIFNLPTRMNASTYFGKDGPMLELVKVLCGLLGYDLNPDSTEKDANMDDQISFIEAATWYLTHPKSPFAEHQPELFIYRDIVAMYKIMISQTDHRRSIKVHRWTTADVELKWRIKEVNKAKTMIDINIEVCGEEAVCLDALPIYSAADASSYVPEVHMPSEDDILHALNLPSFDSILSEEDAELLLSYLTAPYIRIPLVVAFFSTKDRVAVLLNRDVQAMIESVLFEPRQFVTEYEAPQITQIPAASRAQIGAARGMLLNELIHNPAVLLQSLLQMAKLTLDLNTGDYSSSSRHIILFVVRLMVRVEAHLSFVLDHPDEVFRHHRLPSPEYLVQLETSRAELRAYFLGPIRAALSEWESAASANSDLVSCCVFHAHLALLYRGVRAHEWDAGSVAAVLSHSAFLRTWYSAGLTGEAAQEDGGQVGDNFYTSNAHGMATRYGMSHMGRGGMMMGRGGGGYVSRMANRMMGMGGNGRGLGDDEPEESEDQSGGSSSSRRRGGKTFRPAGKRSKKKGGKASGDDSKDDSKDAAADKKKALLGTKAKKPGEESSSDEEDDEEDDIHLPGLGEEASVAQLKEKNAGEGKATDKDLPVLEVPDQELFELLQYVRRGFVSWMATKAKASDVDDVLQGCLAASTRTPSVVSRGWRQISSTPGIWVSENADLEVNVQVAELYFRHSTIEPVPNFVAMMPDYVSLFGSKPMHCALVASHDHRYWCRMVGQAYSLKRWDRVEPELVLVNQPTPIPAPNLPGVTWICFVDGQANPIGAESCSKCNKRERPKYPHGFRFEETQYSRMFVPPQMSPNEKWIFEAVEPVLGALMGGRAKMAWEIFLPADFAPADVLQVKLLGKDDMNSFREFIVHRHRNVCQIFSLLEHGRRIFRSLDYSSDSRFSLRYLEPMIKDRAFAWEPQVRHGAGRLLPAFWDASLVITRDRVDELGNKSEETFVPSRFLYGLLPSALLDHFMFWQRAETDSFVGYPRDRADANWFYKLQVKLIQLPDGIGRVKYDAVITRHKLDPLTLEQEDPRASDQSQNTFEMKKSLEKDDPLQVAINQSKVATLKEQGLSEHLATQLLQRFDYDLPIAQSWIADASNAAELTALKAADPEAQIAINEAARGSAFSLGPASDSAPSKQPQLLLLNLLHATPGTMLYRIATVLSRIEDINYICAWHAGGVSAVGEEVSIALIELPRLKLKLQPRLHVDEKGVESVRLYSLDHSNLFLSDFRDDLLNSMLAGLNNSILLENPERELFVLIPNGIVHRPNITSEPFSGELVPERGASSWMAVQDSRYFLYPVHGSHTFLLTPTQSSAVYLVLLRLLARQYTEAFNVIQSCEADMKLSDSEEWVLQQLEKAQTDFHPNAAAIRLKISLMLMHAQVSYPWRIQDEYKMYLEKLGNVAAICRLSVDEEIYLLHHLRSGEEFEDINAMEGGDENELDAAPKHLDTALANRLSFLSAMIADEEQYAHESASLAASSGRDAVPLLTRTASGRKSVFLTRPMQRGCKPLWGDVETAVDRFYSNFSAASRTWDAQIEYKRPDGGDTMLGPAIKMLNGVWKDTITGLGRKLGFFFLADMLTRQVDICLTDPGVSSAPGLAKLLGRLLYLKSTAWGVRSSDLAVHKSYRERSFVPFVCLALLERLPLSVAKSAPKMPFNNFRPDFINGCSVSNQEPELSPAARYLDQLLVFTQQFLRMTKSTNLAVQPEHGAETIIVPSLHSLISAPQGTDFACNQRRIAPFEHDEVVLSEADCKCFSDQLLSCIDLPRFVSLVKSEERVAAEVPFDVSQHVDAQTHVAKSLISRMNADVGVYARMVNEGTVPKLAFLLDDTLAHVTQLHATGEHPYIPSSDPKLSAQINESVVALNVLIAELDKVAAADYSQIPLAVAAILDLGNAVDFDDEKANDDENAMPDAVGAGVDTHLTRMQFLLNRYSELRPSLTLEYLCGCLLSTHLTDDIRAVNPFLPAGSAAKITEIAQAFLLRVNRLGHVYRCNAMAVELIGMLRGLSSLGKHGADGKTERLIAHKQLAFKASALASALVTRRFCFGPNAFVTQAQGSLSPLSSSAGASSALAGEVTAFDFEPRYLLFEYLFNILLRNQQVKLLHTFLKSKSAVQQMIMGAGKTTVIGPLLALILADGSRLVMQVVPSALLEFSRSIMRSRFTRVLTKRIATMQFDRSVKKISHVTRLFDKLNVARKSKGVVITTPESIKALALKHIELLHLLESAPANLSPPAQLRLKIRSEMADQLAHILNMWRQGNLILDEVDLLLHPLRSELNFPILEKTPLDLSPDRWELPIHLLDAIFFSQTGVMSVAFGKSDSAIATLEELRAIIAEGVAGHAIQSSPHLVLLSPAFYHSRMLLPLANWLMFWLRSKQHLHVRLPEETAIEFLTKGSLGASPACISAVRELHGQTQRKILNLSHDWLTSFMPHCLAKIDRVSFGLLTAEDMALVDQNMPTSRKLMAVPFVGKDVPSHASEFSHPDILIGLTILAYRYEGIRRSDVRRVISSLQRSMRNQVGPFSQRPASILFETWATKGKVFAQIMHKKQVADEEAEYKQSLIGTEMSDAATSSSSSSSSSSAVAAAAPRPQRKLKLAPIVPLSIFQLSDRLQMRALYTRVRHLPDLVHYYLQQQVFPAVLQHQTTKLSASGQELGGSMLFDLRFGGIL